MDIGPDFLDSYIAISSYQRQHNQIRQPNNRIRLSSWWHNNRIALCQISIHSFDSMEKKNVDHENELKPAALITFPEMSQRPCKESHYFQLASLQLYDDRALKSRAEHFYCIA